MFATMKLMMSLNRIEKLLCQDNPDVESLRKAYELTLRLRSQLLSAIYDYEQYGTAEESTTEIAAPVTSQNKRLVTLTINEPLPGLKELTAAVEDHWISMIHKAIFEESKTGIPKFEKAFVMIEITTPRGCNNPKVWDTSNRAINVIINNLKGIFFRDDDFEHMACGIVADWGENGQTTIRICELEDLLGSVVFGAKIKNL